MQQPILKLRRCPRFDSCAPGHFDLSVCPSMLLASPRLHSRSCPRPLCLLCRLSHSLHSSDVMANEQTSVIESQIAEDPLLFDRRNGSFYLAINRQSLKNMLVGGDRPPATKTPRHRPFDFAQGRLIGGYRADINPWTPPSLISARQALPLRLRSSTAGEQGTLIRGYRTGIKASCHGRARHEWIFSIAVRVPVHLIASPDFDH